MVSELLSTTRERRTISRSCPNLKLSAMTVSENLFARLSAKKTKNKEKFDGPSNRVIRQSTGFDVLKVPGDDVRSSRSDNRLLRIPNPRIESSENDQSAKICNR